MLKVTVYNIAGQQVGEMELNEQVFGVEQNSSVVHDVVVNQLANKRQGTQSALTRAEVRGGGRKPWRQKGTGRARQGSTRAPQWRHGGVAFAVKPRDYSYTLNKKVRRIALKSVLSSRVTENKIIVLDAFNLEAIKTKEMQKVLENFKLNKALIVMGDNEQNVKNVVLSARNIQGIKTSSVNSINVYDILKYGNFVVTKEAVSKIQEVYA